MKKRNQAALYLILAVFLLLSVGIPFVIHLAVNGWDGFAVLYIPALLISLLVLATGVAIQNKLASNQFMGEEISELVQQSLQKMTVPVVLTEQDGKIFWYNDIFRTL